MLNQQIQVKTKLNKDDKNPKLTIVTYNFAGVTVEELAGPAMDTLTINLQSGWRRNGSIPQKLEVNVKDMISRMGSRSSAPLTAEGIKAVASTMSLDEVNALIKQMGEEAKARADAEKKAAKDAEKPAAKTTKTGKKDGDGKGDQTGASA